MWIALLQFSLKKTETKTSQSLRVTIDVICDHQRAHRLSFFYYYYFSLAI